MTDLTRMLDIARDAYSKAEAEEKVAADALAAATIAHDHARRQRLAWREFIRTAEGDEIPAPEKRTIRNADVGNVAAFEPAETPGLVRRFGTGGGEP